MAEGLRSKEELRQAVFDYIRAGEAHSILVGFAVDTVNGSDERLNEWCDRMVGYVIDAVDYQEQKREEAAKQKAREARRRRTERGKKMRVEQAKKSCPGVVVKPTKKS